MPVPNGSITFRLDPELQAAFSASCKAADLSAAQVLRAAVRDFVNANPQPSRPLAAPKGRMPRS